SVFRLFPTDCSVQRPECISSLPARRSDEDAAPPKPSRESSSHKLLSLFPVPSLPRWVHTGTARYIRSVSHRFFRLNSVPEPRRKAQSEPVLLRLRYRRWPFPRPPGSGFHFPRARRPFPAFLRGLRVILQEISYDSSSFCS